MKVTFYGVRGSTPSPAGANARYGGNTSCVVVEAPGTVPIVLDLGTGLQTWGRTLPLDGSFAAVALVTHFHFDHVQGLPFLAAADRPGASLHIYGPGETGSTTAELFTGFVRPPYFPVTISDLRGSYGLHDVLHDDFTIGEVAVRVRPVPHVGLTVGFRLEHEGTSIAYISDHQAPADLTGIADGVLELCDGADLVIHDAQYTPVDWETKSHWGHCTVDYAVRVAAAGRARALALFHPDPARRDEEVDALAAAAASCGAGLGVEVFAASEGLVLETAKPILPQVRAQRGGAAMFPGLC